MRLAELELDTDYAYNGWHRLPDRVRVTDLAGQPRYSSGRTRNAVAGMMYDPAKDRWQPATLTLTKIVAEWDHPEQVRLRSRHAAMDAEANRLRQMCKALGLIVGRPGVPYDRARPPEAFVRAYLPDHDDQPHNILVEIEGTAFRRVLTPLLEEREEARADLGSG